MADKDPVLETARELGLVVPVVQALHRRILRAIERGGTLDMGDWHHTDAVDVDSPEYAASFCGTAHCRAGWTTFLAGKAGLELEKACGRLVFGSGRSPILDLGFRHVGECAMAAELIIRASSPHVNIEYADFFCGNDEALEQIRDAAELEPPIDDKETP